MHSEGKGILPQPLTKKKKKKKKKIQSTLPEERITFPSILSIDNIKNHYHMKEEIWVYADKNLA